MIIAVVADKEKTTGFGINISNFLLVTNSFSKIKLLVKYNYDTSLLTVFD